MLRLVIRHTKPIIEELKSFVAQTCQEQQWLIVWQSESGQIDRYIRCRTTLYLNMI